MKKKENITSSLNLASGIMEIFFLVKILIRFGQSLERVDGSRGPHPIWDECLNFFVEREKKKKRFSA